MEITKVFTFIVYLDYYNTFICLGRLVPYGYLLYNKYLRVKLVDCTQEEVRAKITF